MLDRRSGLGLCLALSGLLVGCSGGDFASEVSARPAPTSLSRRDEFRFRLPADEKFSIALAPSRQAPGLGGTAHAVGKAQREGTAELSADIESGGEAEATCQVGHVFRNDTEQQLDLEVSATVEFEYTAEVPAAPTGVNVDVGLRLYARNSRNLLVRNHSIVAHTVEDGSGARRGQETLKFVQALAPGESITVFVAGRAAVKAEFGKSAACRLALRRTEMDVTTRTASGAAATRPAGG